MKSVFVLMADWGYDGKMCFGVFATEEAAKAAAHGQWFASSGTYVVECKIGELHDKGI